MYATSDNWAFTWHSTPAKGPMFSRENRRFTLLLIAAIILATVTVGQISTLISSGYSQSVFIVTGFSSVMLLQLLAMLRTEQTGALAKRTARKAEEIKGAVEELGEQRIGDVSHVLHTAVDEVKRAASEPAPGQEAMPRTPEELQALLKTFARTMTEDLVHRAAVDAAEKAAKLASEAAVRETVRIVTDEMRKLGYPKE